MAQATLVPSPRTVADPFVPPPARAGAPLSAFRFESLIATEPRSLAKGRGTTLVVSLALHSILIIAVVVIPLFFYDSLPAPDEGIHAFFVTPVAAAPPPPPPPPPAAGVRVTPRAPVVPQSEEPARFVAPTETPTEVKPDEGISLAGVEGGVPGGVEGGVPGGDSRPGTVGVGARSCSSRRQRPGSAAPTKRQSVSTQTCCGITPAGREDFLISPRRI